jgi:hypothetical protein
MTRDTLRDALRRIEDIAIDSTLSEGAAFRAIRSEVRAALAASSEAEGLDVERLAALPSRDSTMPLGERIALVIRNTAHGDSRRVAEYILGLVADALTPKEPTFDEPGDPGYAPWPGEEATR